MDSFCSADQVSYTTKTECSEWFVLQHTVRCEPSSVWSCWSKSHFRNHFGACTSSAPLLFLAQAFTFFFISTSIVLQCDKPSSIAFLRGTIAGALLLSTMKRPLIYLSCTLRSCSMWGPFVLMCQYVQWKPMSCQYVFTWVPPRQIPPFYFIMEVVLGLKKNTSACLPCQWFAIIFKQIRAWYYSIMHAHYTVI